MPYDGFKWVHPSLSGLNEMENTSKIGKIYEVDVTYPSHLHELHNDLPFLPYNETPPGSKIKKLMGTFIKKERYVVHYNSLKQAIANGLIVEKVNIIFKYYYYIIIYHLLFFN